MARLIVRLMAATALVSLLLLGIAHLVGRALHNEEIAYVGGSQIYVMDINRGFTVPLTDPNLFTSNPAWSPDGEWIAYEAASQDGYGIYIMNSVGRNVRRLTEMRAGNPAWSPDGRQIAFHSEQEGSYEIYIINADGSDVRQLTNNSYPDYNPAWSPDGTRILFQSYRTPNATIYSMDTDGHRMRLLTSPRYHSLDPAWSPDGKRIIFLSTLLGYQTLHVADFDGTGVRLLLPPSSYNGSPAWSPDGTRILFDSSRPHNGLYTGWGIYLVNAACRSLPEGCDGDVQFLAQGIRPAWRPG
jgi:TolB protein